MIPEMNFPRRPDPTSVTVAALNKKLSGKMLRLYIVYLILCLVSYLNLFPTAIVKNFVAEWIPNIDRMTQDGPHGDFAGRFFSLMVAGLPFTFAYIIYGERPLERFLYFNPRGKRLKSIFIGYMIGLPFLIFILYISFDSIFGLEDNPRLFGQQVIYLMLHTRGGLLIFGPLYAVTCNLMIALIVFLLSLPMAAIAKFWR